MKIYTYIFFSKCWYQSTKPRVIKMHYMATYCFNSLLYILPTCLYRTFQAHFPLKFLYEVRQVLDAPVTKASRK